MTQPAQTLHVVFQPITCNCGGVYLLPDTYLERQRRRAGTWHCPYCQAPWGYHETEADRLRKALERERETAQAYAAAAERARASQQHAVAVANGYKGAIVKLRKRVGAGVCPCCSRSFENLRRHMQTKHPEQIAS